MTSYTINRLIIKLVVFLRYIPLTLLFLNVKKKNPAEVTERGFEITLVGAAITEVTGTINHYFRSVNVSAAFSNKTTIDRLFVCVLED